MIALLLDVYVLGVWLVFFRFKWLPFTTAAKISAGVVGAVGILGVLIALNFLHPQSTDARVVQHVVPVATRTSQPARVAEVRVGPNVPVKAGDVLFTLDDRTYRFEVARLEAALVEAERTVPQLRAARDAAAAAARRAESQRGLAQANFDRTAKLRATGAVSAEEADTARRNLDAAADSLAVAAATEAQARIAIDIGAAKVDETRAALGKAKLDLEETVVKAPADGFVTNLQLRPGFVVRPGDPVLTYVCDPEGVVVVTFPQEYLGTIEPGNEVEVCLDFLPGRTLKGAVEAVIQGSGAGQLDATGTLPTVTAPDRAARFPVKVRLAPAEVERYRPPAGASGAAAVYTDYGKGLRVVRRVVLRWYTWLNFVKVGM